MINENKVEYEGENYSVTGLAQKMVVEKLGWGENTHVNGWRFFTKDGRTLCDFREFIEEEDEDEDWEKPYYNCNITALE